VGATNRPLGHSHPPAAANGPPQPNAQVKARSSGTESVTDTYRARPLTSTPAHLLTLRRVSPSQPLTFGLRVTQPGPSRAATPWSYL
jgi:hypothetical protein